MFVILSEMSTLASVFKLFLLLVVFFVLLYFAHLFTKWYAKSGILNARSSNIAVLESQQISPGKNIVIAKIGNKVVSFLLLKDNAVLLAELDEESLEFPQKDTKAPSFQDILKKAGNRNKKP